MTKERVAGRADEDESTQQPLSEKTLLFPLSSRAKPTCPGVPWRDLQFQRTFTGNVGGFLLRYDRYCDGNGMRGHAGVGVTGLVVQASFQDVLSRLRCQVGVENELTGVDA